LEKPTEVKLAIKLQVSRESIIKERFLRNIEKCTNLTKDIEDKQTQPLPAATPSTPAFGPASAQL
jgi:hypothetical protein